MTRTPTLFLFFLLTGLLLFPSPVLAQSTSCLDILAELVEAGIEPEDGIFIVFPDRDHPERPIEAYCRFDGEDAETFFWIERETGARTDSLYGAAWTSDTTAFVVGTRALLRSEDAGRTWNDVDLSAEGQAVLDQAALRDVAIRPDGIGLAVGGATGAASACVVLRTADHGASWASADSTCGDAPVLQSVAHAGDSVWVAVGGDRILRSTDDGATWTTADVFTAIQSMTDVAFGSDGAGMATDSGNDGAGAGQVLFTRNAGSTWQHLGIFTRVRAVDHLSGGLFAVSGRGVFVRAHVDGSPWFVRGIGGASDLQDVTFVTPEIGFAIEGGGAGAGVLYRTEDGGTSWSIAEEAMHGRPLRRLAMHDEHLGLAVGLADGLLQTSWSGGTPAVDVAGESGSGAASATFRLDSAYPNPFRGEATIAYTIGAAGDVSLSVYDVLGRRVARLADEPKAAGAHTVPFDGRRLASGVYVVRLRVGDRAETQRVTLLR